jgi:hypothetical protein
MPFAARTVLLGSAEYGVTWVFMSNGTHNLSVVGLLASRQARQLCAGGGDSGIVDLLGEQPECLVRADPVDRLPVLGD